MEEIPVMSRHISLRRRGILCAWFVQVSWILARVHTTLVH